MCILNLLHRESIPSTVIAASCETAAAIKDWSTCFRRFHRLWSLGFMMVAINQSPGGKDTVASNAQETKHTVTAVAKLVVF